MTGTLAGTAALVTGASSGIGAATARALAAQGAAVALLARRAERLRQVKTDIESAGGTALAVAADVTNADEVAAGNQPRGTNPTEYRAVRPADHLIPVGRNWQDTIPDAVLARF